MSSQSDLYPQSSVRVLVIRLHEDSLQLPRPEPVVQQQAQPLRVTAVCNHIYRFKQIIAGVLLRQLASSLELSENEGIDILDMTIAKTNVEKVSLKVLFKTIEK